MRISERWRRALACHGEEIAKAEIEFDLMIINRAIVNRENYYDLDVKQAKVLYPLLLKIKDRTLNTNLKKGANKKLMSFRLSEDARFKLEMLAERGGVSRTAVLENLLGQQGRFEIAIPEGK
tara:strand:- start:99 stop:464 length:366 start_codon:yes stop_codon:yes gene_type:complete